VAVPEFEEQAEKVVTRANEAAVMADHRRLKAPAIHVVDETWFPISQVQE
jgi:hypothetical protein